MERSDLQFVLREQQYQFRQQEPGIARLIDLSPHLKTLSHVSIITGVRRCGKSTLLLQMRDLLAAGQTAFFYLRFDDPRLNLFDARDFEVAHQIWLELFPPPADALRVMLFDEVQLISGWEKWADFFSRQKNTKVIVTGSNSSILSSELATFLTGRQIRIHLSPFSFREIALHTFPDRLDSPDLRDTTEGTVQLRRLYRSYENLGGFPRVFIDQNPALLPELYEDITVRDILRRARRANPQSIVDLSHILLAESSRLFNRSKIASAIGVRDPVTVGRYCQLFKNAYLFNELRQFSPSLRKRLRSLSKFYAVDHSLPAHAAAGAPTATVLEHIVINELARSGCDIFYWHSSKGYEVDFLCARQRRPERAVQVCAALGAAETRQREVRALLAAAEELNVQRLEIVTLDDREEISQGAIRIAVIPIWEWLLTQAG